MKFLPSLTALLRERKLSVESDERRWKKEARLRPQVQYPASSWAPVKVSTYKWSRVPFDSDHGHAINQKGGNK